MFNCLDQYWCCALGFPGNPGVVGFYRTFMQTIHSMCDYRHPVWAVSHAGHCAPPDSMDMVEGKLCFLFIVRADLLFFSNREGCHNQNELPLIVIWYICILYKAGLFTLGKCNPPITHISAFPYRSDRIGPECSGRCVPALPADLRQFLLCGLIH